MKWSNDLPVMVGYYWIDFRESVDLVKLDLDNFAFWYYCGQKVDLKYVIGRARWYGPLKPPKN